MKAIAAELRRPQPALVPRIALHLTSSPVTGGDRLAGHRTIAQIVGDLEQLRSAAWRALATVAERCTE